MKQAYCHLRMGQPLTYRIEVQGHVDERWSNWFEGMEVEVKTGEVISTITVLTGTIPDQAAVHGLLRKLYTLGYVILTVTCLDLSLEDR